MVQRLVLLGIAVLFSLGGGEVPDKGTCLAPAIKAEKIAGEDLFPTGAIFVSGKEEATEGAEVAAGAIWPSQLESCRDSPSDSSSSRHDLVLQALRSSEQSKLREMPLLSKALESGMGGLKAKRPKQKQDPQVQRRDTGRSKGRGHMAGFPGEGPLDSVNPFQDFHVSGRNCFRCQGQGDAATATASLAAAASCAESSCRGYDHRGGQALGAPTWFTGYEASALRGHAAEVTVVDRQGATGGLSKSIVSWPPQSPQQGQESSRRSSQEDQGLGCRMAGFHEAHNRAGAPARSDVPRLPCIAPGNLQPEAPGFADVEEGGHSSHYELGGSASARTRCGRTAIGGRTHGGAECDLPAGQHCGGDANRSHGGPNGGCRRGRAHGGGTQREEILATCASAFPLSSFSYHCGQISPQVEAREGSQGQGCKSQGRQVKPSPSSVDSDVGDPSASWVPTSWPEVVATLQSDVDFLDIPFTWITSTERFSHRALRADFHHPVIQPYVHSGAYEGSRNQCGRASRTAKVGQNEVVTSVGIDVDASAQFCRRLQDFSVEAVSSSLSWCSPSTVVHQVPFSSFCQDDFRIAHYKELEPSWVSHSMGLTFGSTVSRSTRQVDRIMHSQKVPTGVCETTLPPDWSCDVLPDHWQMTVSGSFQSMVHAPLRTCVEANSDLCEVQGVSKSQVEHDVRLPRQVSFAAFVDVHLFEDDHELHFQLPEIARWDMLRHFWHQDGQVMQWSQMSQVVNMLSNQFAGFDAERYQLEDSRESAIAHGTSFHHFCPGEDFAMWWHEVASQCAERRDRRPTFIATWFLSQGEFSLCVRPRRIKTHSSMSFEDFRQSCKLAWQELLNGNQLTFALVDGHPPSGLPSTVAHVIIVQGDPLGHNALLLHGNNLPLLSSTRAVLFEHTDTISRLFQTAQFPETCFPHRFVCAVHFNEGGHEVSLTTSDLADIPHAKFVQAYMRTLEEDISDDEQSECSTREPDSSDEQDDEASLLSTGERTPQLEQDSSLDALLFNHGRDLHTWEVHSLASGLRTPFGHDTVAMASLSHSASVAISHEFEPLDFPNGASWTLHQQSSESDETSCMAFTPTMLQFDHPNPYPWQVTDPEDLMEDQPPQPVETDFAAGHRTQANDFIVLAEEVLEDSIQAWTAVTFGLGLLDLGRRDVEFDPDNLEALPRLIDNLWADHRAYGDLTIFFVNPQPSEIAGVRTLVLIFVVENPDDVNPDVRNVLIIPRGPPEAGLRPTPYAAKVFTDISFHDALVQLDLHKKCKPWAMRDCTVRMGYHVLVPGVLYDVEHGMCCNVRIHERPAEVTRAMQHIINVETFYLQLEEVQAIAESIHMVTCCVHAITPNNRPMGSRQLVLEGNDLLRDEWIDQLRQIWTFPNDDIRIVFCPMATGDLRELTQPVFHFLIDFGGQEGVPVLVEQQVLVLEDIDRNGGINNEFWAIALAEGPIASDAVEALSIPPFWLGYAVRHNIKPLVQVNGRRMIEIHNDWQPGDHVRFRMQVFQRHQLLSILLHVGEEREIDDDIETTNLLQTNQRTFSRRQRQIEDRATSPLAEYCVALQHWQAFNTDETESAVSERDESLEIRVEEAEYGGSKDDMVAHLREDLFGLFAPDWIGLNRDFAMVPDLHPFACLAAQTTQVVNKPTGIFHVFTDGSSHRHAAAWAFVVLCEGMLEGRRIFYRVGYASGLVDESLGPVQTTALDAEATAIIAGVEYILSRPHTAGLHITFHYDAIAVGHGSIGTQSTPQTRESFSERQHAARIMMSILQQRATCVQGLHVKAHVGQPWNECADSIANLTRKGWRAPCTAVLRSGKLLCNPLRDWAWIEAETGGEIPSLQEVLANAPAQPNSGSHDSLLAPADLTFSGACPLQHSLDTASVTDHAKLRLVTMNVGTMGYGLQDGTCSYKANELLNQLLGGLPHHWCARNPCPHQPDTHKWPFYTAYFQRRQWSGWR